MFIESILLNTPSIDDCKSFYRDRLNLSVRDTGESSIEIDIGQSILKFQESDDFSPYHFAIAIPPNLEKQCLRFTKDNLEHCEGPGGEDVIDFSNWNSRSIYFTDQDSNIVEFIARRDIEYDYDEQFTPECFRLINEMGLVVRDIEDTYEKLNKELGCEIYSGDMERFSAIGDKHGLLITINKKKDSWFPTDIVPDYADFQAVLSNGSKKVLLKARDGEIELDFV